MHPDNQLPYVDRLVGLVIPDTAVYHSALQTGKLDAGILEWTKAETFKVQVPDMLWKAGGATFSRPIFLMADKEPFTDVRVRQALSLGFDNQKMIEEYYGGNALLNGWPAQPGTEGYTAIENMPQECREIYEYHPDKAKALLTEAGYPNGFKTNVYVGWDSAEEIMLIVADDWATIGVELEVVRIDYATWSGHLWNKSAPQMIITWWENTSAAACLAAAHGGIYPPHVASFGNVIDPVAEEVFGEYLSMWSPDDAAERAAMLKQEYLREILLSWTIYTPTPYPLLFWWPWLKNIHGISTMGRGTEVGTVIKYKYVWVDRDLKYQMVGTRD
jgi:peptide/nickel transport system substrate-binding protein